MLRNQYMIFFCCLFCVITVASCKEGLVLTLSVSPDNDVEVDTTMDFKVDINFHEELDEIKWFINGTAIDDCRDEEECSLTPILAGTYRIKVKGKRCTEFNTMNCFSYLGNTPEDNEDTDSIRITVTEPVPVDTGGDSTDDSANVEICENHADDLGGNLIKTYSDRCLISQTGDRGACRGPDYSDCISYEEAQTQCSADWRLPTPEEWVVFRREWDTIFQSFCLTNQGDCEKHKEDGVTYKPYNYVLDGDIRYSANEIQIGKWTFGGWFYGDTFRPETDYMSIDYRFSVRCVQTVAIE